LPNSFEFTQLFGKGGSNTPTTNFRLPKSCFAVSRAPSQSFRSPCRLGLSCPKTDHHQHIAFQASCPAAAPIDPNIIRKKLQNPTDNTPSRVMNASYHQQKWPEHQPARARNTERFGHYDVRTGISAA
jgi:hypothetical protein